MSPGSIAETVYGRRGGGWAPKPSDAPQAPAKPKPVDDRLCRVCLELNPPRNVKIAEHPTERCAPCGGYVCHHQADDEELCWEGKARMAAAKRSTGAVLNEVEVAALARHPVPLRLTPAGYVR